MNNIVYKIRDIRGFHYIEAATGQFVSCVSSVSFCWCKRRKGEPPRSKDHAYCQLSRLANRVYLEQVGCGRCHGVGETGERGIKASSEAHLKAAVPASLPSAPTSSSKRALPIVSMCFCKRVQVSARIRVENFAQR